MTKLDDKILPLAKSLIEAYGRNVIFKNPTATVSNYNPLTRKTTFPSTTEITVKMTPAYPNKAQLNAGNTDEYGKAVSYIAAKDLTFTPKIGMLIIDSSLTWTIMSINTISSGEEIAVYELVLTE